MRLLLAISLLVAGCLHAQQDSAAGTVVDQMGKPLAGVHIRLITGDFDSDDGVDTLYGVNSDPAGHFSVNGLKPGVYMVMAQRAGYEQEATNGMPMLVVKAGQPIDDYKIVMAERAVIAGRVVDEYGDPVQNVPVQVEPGDRNASQYVAFHRTAMVSTDDRGEFRLVTGPGKYYVKTSANRGYRGPLEIRTDGTNGAPFIATYYPSAANKGSAAAVQVSAGQDVAGIEIHLLRSSSSGTARTFTIGGIVTGMPTDSVPSIGGVTVMLFSGEKSGEYRYTRSVGLTADGAFKAAGIQPGYYRLSASYSVGKTNLQSRPLEFHVDSADQTGLVLALAAPEELFGKLEFVGDAPRGIEGKHTVRLELTGPGTGFGQGNPSAAAVAADGSFHLTGIPPFRFKLIVEPMPENGYLKEVALDDKALPDQILDFTQGVGGSKVKIIVNRNGGRISGRVLDESGKQASGFMRVFVGTDPKHMDGENAVWSSDGKFSIKALRPGKYHVVAVDVSEMMQAYSGDTTGGDMTQRLFDAGQEVEVKEGESVSKDLPLLTKLPEKKEQ